jgi:26S proteasome regulatory subunit N2
LSRLTPFDRFSERLHENSAFSDRKLAALVASKVYFHVGALKDSTAFALAAEELFDVASASRFVETIVSKCIDEYIRLRTAASAAAAPVDPRLQALVERMLQQSLALKQYRHAVGVALESRRIDVAERVLAEAGAEEASLLRYIVAQCAANTAELDWRATVLRLAARRYEALAVPDRVAAMHCLLHLGSVEGVAALLAAALGDGTAPGARALAYQLAFDLEDNASQQFLARVNAALPAAGDGEAAKAAFATVSTILSGRTTVDLSLEFLYKQCKSDLNILRRAKAAIEPRSSICHNGLVLANALMHAGTMRDAFLRRNLEWMSRATNWAKFSATASLGVIHRGHIKQAFHLLSPYIAANAPGARAPSGPSASEYAEGGGLFALGLIYANYGAPVRDYFVRQLAASQSEIVKHGACLGVGVALMATSDEPLYDELKNILYQDSAVAGEAAALGMGLVMCGTGHARAVSEMMTYANDTQHEKIERALAIGLAVVMQGREQAADALITQLQQHKSPIMRYGAMLAVALAYAGTADNGAIARLLHDAVSDPSDDVRRAAVMALGFVLCRQGEQCVTVVSLLAESYNPHLRYGSALALGISCAATGSTAALRILKPLLTDTSDFVRQGALIAHAMILQHHSVAQLPEVDELRKLFASTLGDKHQSQMAKFGALLATGIVDAGGRNCAITLVSRSGLIRQSAVVGTLLFLHHWYWYPSVHFLSLAFAPSAVIAINERFKMPKFQWHSNARPSLFAYPPDLVEEKKVAKTKVSTAVLSYTKKGAPTPKKGEAMQVDDEPAAAAAAAPKAEEKKKPEPTSEVLSNPARVTRQQLPHITFDVDERYSPIIQSSDVPNVCAIVLLLDRKPGEPEELVFPEKQPAAAAAAAAAAAPKPTTAAAASTTSAAAAPPPAASSMDEDAAPPASFDFDPNAD